VWNFKSAVPDVDLEFEEFQNVVRMDSTSSPVGNASTCFLAGQR
jgi:hypothetical protein